MILNSKPFLYWRRRPLLYSSREIFFWTFADITLQRAYAISSLDHLYHVRGVQVSTLCDLSIVWPLYGTASACRQDFRKVTTMCASSSCVSNFDWVALTLGLCYGENHTALRQDLPPRYILYQRCWAHSVSWIAMFWFIPCCIDLRRKSAMACNYWRRMKSSLLSSPRYEVGLINHLTSSCMQEAKQNRLVARFRTSLILSKW